MLVLTLFAAVALVSSLGIAAHLYGTHSTPCIWLAFLNLPGVLFIAWLNGGPGFLIAVLVNWIFYSLIVLLIMRLVAWMKGTRISS